MKAWDVVSKIRLLWNAVSLSNDVWHCNHSSRHDAFVHRSAQSGSRRHPTPHHEPIDQALRPLKYLREPIRGAPLLRATFIVTAHEPSLANTTA